jgi:hypothetical protein
MPLPPSFNRIIFPSSSCFQQKMLTFKYKTIAYATPLLIIITSDVFLRAKESQRSNCGGSEDQTYTWFDGAGRA